MSGFDGERAFRLVQAQCALGPRPTGSPANRRCAELIASTLAECGWPVEEDAFLLRGQRCRNLLARTVRERPALLLGAHFDTRPRADRERSWWRRRRAVPGANDGASGVAVLLELARVLDQSKVNKQVWLAFFDAEDCGNINGWPFSVGAAHMAEHLSVQPKAVVVVDMVGDEDQRFMWETASNDALNRSLWAVAADLGYQHQFIPRLGYSIIDDHVPFLQRGFTAIDIIDFDYPYWHTTQDTPDKVSPESLQRIGRVLQKWLEQ